MEKDDITFLHLQTDFIVNECLIGFDAKVSLVDFPIIWVVMLIEFPFMSFWEDE